MPSNDRRVAARRRAWGLGPTILRFEPLEGRQLLTASFSTPLPDLISTSFQATGSADWGGSLEVVGRITNQGTAPVPPGALAGVYASPTRVIGPGSQLIGVIQVQAGLQPGLSEPYDIPVTLPISPIAGVASYNAPIWLGVRIDPNGLIQESNKVNNEGIGPGVDQAQVAIAPARPSNLVGNTFGVSPTTTTWGSTVTVTAQISNDAQGASPPTRAKVVLTPNGQVPGGAGDVTVGSLQVPALPAFQTTNVVQQITLPATAPSLLAGQGAYYLSMIQDADHAATPLVTPTVLKGLGFDTSVLTIGAGTATADPSKPLPDLAASGVVAPATPIYWGQSFQVSTSVQNIGKGDSPGFKLRFLLTGINGATDQAIYLGDASVPTGLKASFSQNVIQTLKLPSRLPYGFDVGPIAYGRVVVIVDPENTVDESYKSNNSATSNPVTLGLFGSDGTTPVPVTPPVRTNTPTPTTVALPVKAPTKALPVPQKPSPLTIRTAQAAAAARRRSNIFTRQFTTYEANIKNLYKDVVKLTAAKKKK